MYIRCQNSIIPLQPSTAQWLLYVPPGLTFTNSTFCPHSVFMCFVWISEQTAIISLYGINLLVFITETESVYSAVRTESLYKTDTLRLERINLAFKGNTHNLFMPKGARKVTVRFEKGGEC
jgi:hypothetical protein